MMAALNLDDYQQDSPSQQSLVLECSICSEHYGPEFNNQPRSLRCGHTFCTSCLMKIISSRGVLCPMCNGLHPLPTPDVMLLPINYAVQEIMKNLSTQQQDSIVNQRECPPCGVCGKNSATVICVDCEPGSHFRFCDKCDTDEHNRPFGPAQRHKRFPIDQAPNPGSYIFCSRHPRVTASLYSEALNEFACSICQTDSDWVTRVLQFVLISDCTKKMRLKVQNFTKYTNDMNKKLSESKQNLETIMNNLEPVSMSVQANITKTFSDCIEVLQERQRTLLLNVEIELKNRKESLKKQHETVVSTNAKYRDAFESLNSLVSKSDVDFLLLYRMATRNVEVLIDNEDKSLLRPLVTQDIPFCISKDYERQLKCLGAVGGGLTPIELECSPSGARGTMMELYWQLPDKCGTLLRFQIEYEQLVETGIAHHGGYVVEPGADMIYNQPEPQFYEVPGNELNAYVDYLCPGYSYRFRIRSANDAGFGMWSEFVTANCMNFPFTLGYTKKIHRIIIPRSGYYRITVKGAKAADGMRHSGGRGAIISAAFSMKAGDVLIMLCGGMSSKHHYHSGGGGGSFVALNEMSHESLLIATGGGGGTRGADRNDFDGSDANIYEDGLDGKGEDFGKGGKSGAPGDDAKDSNNLEGPSFGNGGAGFMHDSSTALSCISGGHAGQNGGFGGGGAVGMYGGGGGGGYSGGGGGRGGGGGGSYVISTAVEVTRDVGNEGHGSIYIEKVVPPYPVSDSFLNHVISNGSNSTTHLSRVVSSETGELGSGTGAMGAHHTSSGHGISAISEVEALHQSPSSTAQVMDQPDEVSVLFTIDDLVEDVEIGSQYNITTATTTSTDSAEVMIPYIGTTEVVTIAYSYPVGGAPPVGTANNAAGNPIEPPDTGLVDSSNFPKVHEVIRKYQETSSSANVASQEFAEEGTVRQPQVQSFDTASQAFTAHPMDPGTSQWITQLQPDQALSHYGTNLDPHNYQQLQQHVPSQLVSEEGTVRQPQVQPFDIVSPAPPTDPGMSQWASQLQPDQALNCYGTNSDPHNNQLLQQHVASELVPQHDIVVQQPFRQNTSPPMTQYQSTVGESAPVQHRISTPNVQSAPVQHRISTPNVHQPETQLADFSASGILPTNDQYTQQNK